MCVCPMILAGFFFYIPGWWWDFFHQQWGVNISSVFFCSSQGAWVLISSKGSELIGENTSLDRKPRSELRKHTARFWAISPKWLICRIPNKNVSFILLTKRRRWRLCSRLFLPGIFQHLLSQQKRVTFRGASSEHIVSSVWLWLPRFSSEVPSTIHRLTFGSLEKL